MNLKPYSEIVGTLSTIQTKHDCTKLIFTIQKEIELPTEAFSAKNLQNLVGKRIGIFNGGGIYRLRKIKA